MTNLSGATKLREALREDRLLEAPCIFDALSARMAEKAGFDAVVLGAGATANFHHGLPDIGLISAPEVVENISRVARAINIPVIADLDDAGGSPTNVRRNVQLAEHAGAAAIMIEDVDMSGKHLWSDEHNGWDFTADKILGFEASVSLVENAVAGRQSSETIILARTNAFQTSGLDEALRRAQAFAAAGAEMIFLAHMPSELMDASVFSAIPVPVVHCEFESPTLQERDELSEAGLKVLGYALQPILGAYYGLFDALNDIKAGRRARDGRTEWDRNQALLETVDLKGWSERLRS